MRHAPEPGRALEAFRSYFDGSRGIAVVLLADRGFLPGMLITLGSLMTTQSLRGASIVMMTNDPAVRDHPFVAGVCRKIFYISDSDIERFAGVSRKNVRKGERHPLIAKYTLLKFFFFSNFDLGDQIFIDCDIVAQKNIDHVTELGRARLAAAPALVHRPAMQPEILAALAAAMTPGIETINSGFMYASSAFLPHSSEIVEGLIREAEASEFRKEQEVVSAYMRTRSDTYSLPISYNFLRSYAERLGEDVYRSVEDDVYLVHYVGRKPWERTEDRRIYVDQAYFRTLTTLEEALGDAFRRLYADLLDQAAGEQGAEHEPASGFGASAAAAVEGPPELFLHVGAHKTGTTFIQNVMRRNSAGLKEEGAHYVHAGKKTYRDILRGKQPYDKDKLVEIAASGPPSARKVIFSEEDALGVCGVSDPVDIYGGLAAVASRLKRAFDGKARYTVLFSIRAYAGFIASAYQQEVKRGRFADSFAAYVARYVDLERISWRPAIETLAAAFPGALVVWTHEALRRDPGRVFAEFGLSANFYDKAVKPAKAVNPSLSALGLAIMRASNGHQVAQSDRDDLTRFVARRFPAGEHYPPQVFWEPAQREALDRRYREDLDHLAAEASAMGMRFIA